MPRYQRHIFICAHSRPPESPIGCCASKGGDAVRAAFRKEVKRRELDCVVRTNKSSCLASCDRGVTVVVYPEGIWYGGVAPEDAEEIVERHVVRGEVVERLLIGEYAAERLNLLPLDLPGPDRSIRDSADGS